MADEGLIIKIFADAKDFVSGANKAVKDAKSKFKGLGDEIGKELKRVETVGATAFKGIAGAIGTMSTTAAAAIGGLVKSSNDAFAEYQQLEGGIKKLFGDGSDELMAYAQEAYKTAGMSANEYMQNVTGFSAALINSLSGDTVKAADIANMAMKDISDNANTFGKYSAQDLAQVYQALAKGTFTTLDNLNLGFGGTKEGMEALIRHAETLDDSFKVVHTTGKNGADEITYSFADMVQAIHIVQKDLNIMDTTEKEAATTISGSLNMVKASWQDVLVSISGGGKDLDKSINQLIESVGFYANNLMPVIEKALNGIGDMVVKLAPIIAAKLPEVTSNILPKLFSAISTLAKGAGDAIIKIIPSLLDAIMWVIPQFLALGTKILASIVEGISSSMDSVEGIAETIVESLFDNLRYLMRSLLPVAQDLIGAIAEGFIEYKALIMEMGIQIITALAQGLAEAAPELAPRMVDLVNKLIEMLVENMPVFIESIITIIVEIANALWDKMDEITRNLYVLIKDICDEVLGSIGTWGPALLKVIGVLLEALLAIVMGILVSIFQNLGKWWNTSLKPWFDRVGDSIRNWFSGIGETVRTKVQDIRTSIVNKVNEIKTNIASKISEIKTNIVSKITEIKTNIESKINEIKTNISSKITEIKTNISTKVSAIVTSVVDTIRELPGKMLEIGTNIVEGIWNGISNAKEWLKEKIKGFISGIGDWFGSVGDWFGGLFGGGSSEDAGASMAQSFTKGVRNGLSAGMPNLSMTGPALSGMTQVSSVTNDNGNVFNFTNYITGTENTGEEIFRQFQRKVRYSGGVL